MGQMESKQTTVFGHFSAYTWVQEIIDENEIPCMLTQSHNYHNQV